MRFILTLILTLFLAHLLPADEAEKIELVKNGMFNDKATKTAFWSLRTGGLGVAMVAPAQEEGSSNILTINVKDISPKPWDFELLQRFETEIPKSTVVYVSFDYKISEGYSFNFYWQEEHSPWPKLLSLHIDSPVDTWQRVQMAVPVHESFGPNATAFSFHLAEKIGTCELRNISAVVLPPGTNPETLNTNTTPVLGGDFYDKDWRALATARMKKNQQVPVTFKVVRKGAPVPDVAISLNQTSRQFQFGVETIFPVFSQEAMKARENDALRKRLASVADSIPKYKQMLLDKKLFSFITFTDGFIWRDYELWGKKVDAQIIDDALAAGFTVRGHALLVPSFMFAPVPCRKMDNEKLSAAVMKHVKELAAKHKGKISQWDVLHGATDYSEIYNKIGVDSLLTVYAAAAKEDPSAELLVSDLRSLSAISDVTLRDSVELADWLIQSGCKVRGVVLGANMKRLDVAPQAMERRLNMVAGRLNVPIHIANFAVNSESDEFQAATIRDYMLLFFSHPNVKSVSFAEGWAPLLLNPKMAFFHDDLSPRPAADVVRKLITEEWVTNAMIKTGHDGTATYTPFKGVYDVSLSNAKGLSKKIQLDLDKLAAADASLQKFEDGTARKTKEGQLFVTLYVD